MATGTLGTAATTSLVSLVWNPMSAQADIATIAANIKGQSGPRTISPGAFSNSGRIHFPGHRGFLLLNPGDYVAYDNWNWPIIVSAQSIAAAGTSWTHNP